MKEVNQLSTSPSGIDQILGTFSHQLRRDTIQYFEQETDESIASLFELVDYLGEGHSDHRKKELEKLLHHNHLPQLSANNWIDYDPRESLIRYKGKENAESALKEVLKIFE